jgi:hypothetical protein
MRCVTLVADDREPVVPERRHQRDLVGRHSPERVAGMVVARLGTVGVAVAAQVGRDDGVLPSQLRGDAVPHDVALREAVHQQDRRTLAPADRVDPHPVHDHVDRLELRPEHRPTVARLDAVP